MTARGDGYEPAYRFGGPSEPAPIWYRLLVVCVIVAAIAAIIVVL